MNLVGFEQFRALIVDLVCRIVVFVSLKVIGYGIHILSPSDSQKKKNFQDLVLTNNL